MDTRPTSENMEPDAYSDALHDNIVDEKSHMGHAQSSHFTPARQQIRVQLPETMEAPRRNPRGTSTAEVMGAIRGIMDHVPEITIRSDTLKALGKSTAESLTSLGKGLRQTKDALILIADDTTSTSDQFLTYIDELQTHMYSIESRIATLEQTQRTIMTQLISNPRASARAPAAGDA